MCLPKFATFNVFSVNNLSWNIAALQFIFNSLES